MYANHRCPFMKVALIF
jgi:hypothetical protein